MKTPTRNVPAMDTTTAIQPYEMTRSEAAVYYWLLAHSKRNPSNLEEYYYIYRNSFTVKKIQDSTFIKSPTSINNALRGLVNKHIIDYDEQHKAYKIYPPMIYVPMSTKVLMVLLAFNKYINSNTLITLLAMCARMTRETPQDVTKTQLGALLGMARQNVNQMDVVVSMYLLRGLGLVDFEVYKYTNRLGVTCGRYHITGAHPQIEGIEDIIGDEEEVNTTSLSELWSTIMSDELV